MSSKVIKPVMNLKQFMVRQQVLKLYRDMMRAIREVPQDDSRRELQDWVRTDFKKNKHHVDEYVIKSLMYTGEQALKELQQSLAISR